MVVGTFYRFLFLDWVLRRINQITQMLNLIIKFSKGRFNVMKFFY